MAKCAEGCKCGRHKKRDTSTEAERRRAENISRALRDRYAAGFVQSEESIRKRAEAQRGVAKPGSGRFGPRTAEEKQAASERQRENWKDPVKRAAWLKSFGESETFGWVKQSAFEDAVARLLDADQVSYQRGIKIGRFRVDFLLESNVVVEANGCYWHACLTCPRGQRADAEELREKERERTEFLEAQGYEVRIVWEHELHGSPID